MSFQYGHCLKAWKLQFTCPGQNYPWTSAPSLTSQDFILHRITPSVPYDVIQGRNSNFLGTERVKRFAESAETAYQRCSPARVEWRIRERSFYPRRNTVFYSLRIHERLSCQMRALLGRMIFAANIERQPTEFLFPARELLSILYNLYRKLTSLFNPLALHWRTISMACMFVRRSL